MKKETDFDWIKSLEDINVDKREEECAKQQQLDIRHNIPIVVGPAGMRSNLMDGFHTITDNRAEKYEWCTAIGNYIERRPQKYTQGEIDEARKLIHLAGTPVDRDVMRRFEIATRGFSREHERLAMEALIEYETEFIMRRYHELQKQRMSP